MPKLLDILNAARGTVPRGDPVIEAQRQLEAKTKLADYAVVNAEVRPLIPGCLNDETLQRLVQAQETLRRRKAAARAEVPVQSDSGD